MNDLVYLQRYTTEELQNEINKRNMKIALWYEFNQNNSGGSFIENDKVTHRIFIQAMSLKDAVSKSEELGVYFNGCDSGIDCPCCGDRWSEPNALEFPVDWGKGSVFNNIEEYSEYMAKNYGWFEMKNDSYLYYLDGTKKVVKAVKR